MAEFNSDCHVRKIFNCAPEHFLREALLCGNLITFTTGGQGEPAPENYTQLLRRDASGAWHRQGRVRHPGAGLFTTELFSPAPNEIHAFYQYHHPGEWMTRLENRRTVSQDGGATWSIPEILPGTLNNLWTGKGIIHSSGRWIFPASFSMPARKTRCWNGQENLIDWAKSNFFCRCCVLFSDDGGKSFRRSEGVPSRGAHLIEPRIVELEQGRLLMLIRSMDERCLYRSCSSDGGATWSEAVPTEIPNPSAKILLLRSPEGKIILVHNPETTRRGSLEVWIGDGNAERWGKKIRVGEDRKRNMNYPDGELDKEGTLHLIWEDARSVFMADLPRRLWM